jgi:hypothetical protein
MMSEPDFGAKQGGATRACGYCCCGIRRRGGMSIVQAVVWNVRTFVLNVKGNGTSGDPIRPNVPKWDQGADVLVVPLKPL